MLRMNLREKNKLKVCHVTSAHNSSDVRIFEKECVPLAKEGYITYLVAPGESRDEKGVHVVGSVSARCFCGA